MLFADYVRGKDSTGVAVIHSNRMVAGGDLKEYLYKRAMPSFDFMFMPGYLKAEAFTRPVLMMGHNRAATRGSITNNNAHPFEAGKIILAHNGTLTNKSALPDSSYFDTDSECIANLLDTKGVEETTNILEGAWALVWWNKKDKTLNFLRNDERDFYYCGLDRGDAMLWSSTEHLMRWAVEHNKGMIDGETKDAYGAVTKTEVNHLYTFAEGSTEPVITEITIKEKERPSTWQNPRLEHNRSTKRERKEQQKVDKKKLLETILGSMVGSKIPFNLKQAHAYKGRVNNSTEGNFITGEVLKGFSQRVFPECTGSYLNISSITDMELSAINKKSKTIWQGTLTKANVHLDTDRISLTVTEVAPFPQYDLVADLKALEEEDVKKQVFVAGPGGVLIPFTDYRIMTADGCSGCGNELTKAMASEIKWVLGDYPVCAKCQSEDRDDLIENNLDGFGYSARREAYL